MDDTHNPHLQKQYFQFAYQTGSDIWSHIPYRFVAQSMLPKLEDDSLVLDLGAGRGLWAMKLLEAGYRVLGIDYVESIVESVNQRIKDEDYLGRGRFILADVLDIPFTDGSFSMATDIGTFQHLQQKEWGSYINEVHRVLKEEGYYLNVSLSKKTSHFLGFNPSSSSEQAFDKFGVHYYFFKNEELKQIFEPQFIILEQRLESYQSKSDPSDEVVLIFSLMQKKER